MRSATQTDKTVSTSPTHTVNSFPDDQKQEASSVFVIIVALVVTASVVLLLALGVIGIVILKVKRQKTFTPVYTSEYPLETFDKKGMQHLLL